MATFKTVVRSRRADGIYAVYIRCTHNRQVEYIKTDYYILEKYVGNRGEIKDNSVLGQCANQINGFIEKLNLANNISKWSAKEVVKYLTNENEKIPFIPYCQKFIDEKISKNQNGVSNYKCAKKSFETYFGKDIAFQDITSNGLRKWIETLRNTARAKETYPKVIKTSFDAGCLEYNDNDRILFLSHHDLLTA